MTRIILGAALVVAWALPVCASECSGFGTWTGVRCLCFEDYTGSECQYQISTHSLVGTSGCSSHGNLEPSGNCVCHVGWGGPRCTTRLCVHGVLGCAAGATACIEPDCTCAPGWHGDACDMRLVPSGTLGSGWTMPDGDETRAPALNVPPKEPQHSPSRSASPLPPSPSPRCHPAPAPPAPCQHGGWRRLQLESSTDALLPPGACPLPPPPPPLPCECPAGSGWSGPLCDACAGPQDCAHGGVWDASACACACPAPWRPADHCSTCDPSAAVPRGVCEHGGQFDAATCSCRCTGGWGGPDCSVCVPLQSGGGLASASPFVEACGRRGFDAAACACHAACPLVECLHGGRQDPDTCECVCSGTTHRGFDWAGSGGLALVETGAASDRRAWAAAGHRRPPLQPKLRRQPRRLQQQSRQQPLEDDGGGEPEAWGPRRRHIPRFTQQQLSRGDGEDEGGSRGRTYERSSSEGGSRAEEDSEGGEAPPSELLPPVDPADPGAAIELPPPSAPLSALPLFPAAAVAAATAARTALKREAAAGAPAFAACLDEAQAADGAPTVSPASVAGDSRFSVALAAAVAADGARAGRVGLAADARTESSSDVRFWGGERCDVCVLPPDALLSLRLRAGEARGGDPTPSSAGNPQAILVPSPSTCAVGWAFSAAECGCVPVCPVDSCEHGGEPVLLLMSPQAAGNASRAEGAAGRATAAPSPAPPVPWPVVPPPPSQGSAAPRFRSCGEAARTALAAAAAARAPVDAAIAAASYTCGCRCAPPWAGQRCELRGSGATAASAGRSCLAILRARPGAGNGRYWVNPSGVAPLRNAFQTHCDMGGDDAAEAAQGQGEGREGPSSEGGSSIFSDRGSSGGGGGGWTTVARVGPLLSATLLDARTYREGASAGGGAEYVLPCGRFSGLDGGAAEGGGSGGGPRAFVLRVTMGGARDFFALRGGSGGGGLCALLTSSQRHLWSPAWHPSMAVGRAGPIRGGGGSDAEDESALAAAAAADMRALLAGAWGAPVHRGRGARRRRHRAGRVDDAAESSSFSSRFAAASDATAAGTDAGAEQRLQQQAQDGQPGDPDALRSMLQQAQGGGLLAGLQGGSGEGVVGGASLPVAGPYGAPPPEYAYGPFAPTLGAPTAWGAPAPPPPQLQVQPQSLQQRQGQPVVFAPFRPFASPPLQLQSQRPLAPQWPPVQPPQLQWAPAQPQQQQWPPAQQPLPQQWPPAQSPLMPQWLLRVSGSQASSLSSPYTSYSPYAFVAPGQQQGVPPTFPMSGGGAIFAELGSGRGVRTDDSSLSRMSGHGGSAAPPSAASLSSPTGASSAVRSSNAGSWRSAAVVQRDTAGEGAADTGEIAPADFAAAVLGGGREGADSAAHPAASLLQLDDSPASAPQAGRTGTGAGPSVRVWLQPRPVSLSLNPQLGSVLGGSARNWPAEWDGRMYLPLWGGLRGGCCHAQVGGGSGSGSATADTPAWGRPFELAVMEVDPWLYAAGGAEAAAPDDVRWQWVRSTPSSADGEGSGAGSQRRGGLRGGGGGSAAVKDERDPLEAV